MTDKRVSALAEHDTKKYWDCSRMTFLNLIIIIALDGGETYRHRDKVFNAWKQSNCKNDPS